MAEPRAALGCDFAALSAYRDGELKPGQRRQITTHLAGCEACRTALHSYALVAATLCEPVVAPTFAYMRSELRARLESPAHQPWRRRLAPGLAAVASAGAAVVVVATGLGGLPIPSRLGPGLPVLIGHSPPASVSTTAATEAPSAVSVSKDSERAERSAVGMPSFPDTAPASGCARPLPSVASLFAQRPEMLQSLGCATDAARMLSLVSQSFERGDLLRRSDTREIYAISQDGRWRLHADPGPSIQTVSLSTGNDRLELSAWFEQTWLDRADIRTLLGQVATGFRQQQGLVQTYERGVALWDGRGLVYVLMENGRSLFDLDQRVAPRNEPSKPPPELETSQPLQGAAI